MKIVKYIEYSEETLNSKFSPKKICESTEANFKLAWHLPFDLDEWEISFNDILKMLVMFGPLYIESCELLSTFFNSFCSWIF